LALVTNQPTAAADGLISPLVFDLLERQGAKTPKERLIKRRLGIVLAIKKPPPHGV
jgi:hypothetical protein